MEKKTIGVLLAKKVAANLQAIEAKRGWNAAEAARRSGIPIMSYYRARAGETDLRLSTVDALAKSFKVQPSTLLK